MATEKIQIIVSESGAVTVANKIKGVGDAAKTSAVDGIDVLKGALIAFIGGNILGKLSDITSSFTDFKSRVDLATDGSINATDAMARLQDMAQRTYSSFANTAESFLANKIALDGLGLSTLQQLDYTEALNNALVISGAKGEQAASVSKSLSDAMMLGKLSGEQLTNVLKNGGEVVNVLAQELGVGADKLKQMGADGKITSDVIYNALIGSFDALQQKAADMPATISDGFLRIQNSVFYLIGSMDQLIGSSALVAGALVWISDNIGLVAIALSPLMIALTALATEIIAVQLLAGFKALGFAIAGLGKSFLGLWAIIIANPFTVLGLAIVAAIGYFVGLQETLTLVIVGFGNIVYAIGKLNEAFGGTNEITNWGISIVHGADKAVEKIKSVAEELKKKINVEIEVGSKAGGKELQEGVERGARNGAQTLAQSAEATYARLNGTLIKPLGDTLVDGGKYIANEVNGSITKAAPALNDNVAKGGETAGSSIQQSMERGSATVFNSIESAFATLGGILDVFTLAMYQIRSDIAKTVAETAKLNAEARKTRAEASDLEKRFKGGGGGPGGGSGGGGGDLTIRDQWRDPNGFTQQMLETNRRLEEAYRAKHSGAGAGTTNPYGTTPSNQNASGPGTTNPYGNVSITNVLDPGIVVEANKSAAGQQSIVNVIKANREQIQSVLGVA